MKEQGNVVVAGRIEDAVGHILLDRPEAMNAVTVELGSQLERALREMSEAVNVIVIRGAGGNFCVGGDFHELERLRDQGREGLRPLFEHFGRACAAIAELPVPVIAAVEGYAMAGGFELMQACDLAVVRDDARIADNHVNFGQVPGGGSSQRLPRLLGRQRALGLLLSGERLTGAQAAEWGLAYRSLAPERFEQDLEAFTKRMADKDRGALATIKKLVYRGLEQSLADGIAGEQETVVEHVGGSAAHAGIAAFKRKGA
ncbi:enoyl-CoA hydratase/isomerase family protein [Sciscionella marina]|uniref:enoyl-CoA hydratase/isomerase family protein n=1 Tax=Sciscionella marina TaxID=508770 RepID=UPI00037E0577|nr:enoyl-CoA hydratase/isomerase family protein [Sciscionella marina]